MRTLVGQREFVGVGELLWDVLPSGSRIGGAPLNVVGHLHQLGARARLISRVGRDELGRRSLQRMEELGLPCDWVQWDEHLPTGTAQATLDADGSARYHFEAPVAFDRLQVPNRSWGGGDAASFGCVIFGTLGQRDPIAATAIRSILQHARYRVLDLNLRAPFDSFAVIDASLRQCDLLKINEHELSRVCEDYGHAHDAATLFAWLQRDYDVEALVVTRGAEGAEFFWHSERHYAPAVAATVVDTIGAGDAFLASLLLDIACGKSPDSALRRASVLASWVVGSAGALPEYDPTRLPQS